MKRYIKSFTTDELKSALGDNYPKGGYLYIFKHGIGPGTIPDDVKVVKVKDLPNYYTAVWLDRFLTTPELKQYDIPDETRITELLNRIGYCQKNGDVVPCDGVNGATEPNSPDVDKMKLVRQVIKQAKEIRDYFQSHNNNLNRKQEQYLEDLSDGIDNESVAAIREAIENMKYNSKNLRSEQYNLIMDLYDEFNLAGGKFEGMGYPEDDDINACGDINCSTRVTASNYDTKLIAKWLKAKFDDEAFGTAYTMHRISDADAYMGRNGLTYNRRNNTIDLWKSGGDKDIPVYKVVPQYSSTKKQGTYAPKLPKLIPIDEWNATHNIEGSTKSRYMADMISASSSDSAYDENGEPYRYYVAGYYSVDSNGHPYGLAESLYTNDFDEALEIAHTYCGNGDYVEFTNQITGMSLDYDPDDWNEAIEYGEFPTSVYDLL